MSDQKRPPRGFIPGTTFIFADGYAASADFCISVLEQVGHIVPAVWPNETYTLEMLCGLEYWSALSPWEHQEAGRIMVRLAAGGWLPLETVGCRHSNPKKYKLK